MNRRVMLLATLGVLTAEPALAGSELPKADKAPPRDAKAAPVKTTKVPPASTKGAAPDPKKRASGDPHVDN